MASDIDLYSSGGQIVPINPGTDLFTPSAEDAWNNDPDYLSDRQVQPLADPQVEQNFQQISAIFQNDFRTLGHPQHHIDAAMNWFRQSLSNPPKQQPKRHSYQLWQYAVGDPIMQAFANWAHTQGIGQGMMTNICWWVGELENRMYAAQKQARQSAVSSNIEDQLTDAQWDQVIVANERAAADTMGRLKDLWGQSFAGNMRLVQNHFASLTDAEQATLSQYTGNFVKGTNTLEILVSLYAEAVQAHTIPRDGASIERELKTITKYIKERRSEYLKDEATQARFRELLNLQSGGR